MSHPKSTCARADAGPRLGGRLQVEEPALAVPEDRPVVDGALEHLPEQDDVVARGTTAWTRHASVAAGPRARGSRRGLLEGQP